MYLVGGSVKLFRKIFNCGLHEHRIRQTALLRFPGRPHRRLFERLCVRVDADVELVRVLLRRRRYKASVAGPDIYHYTFAGMGR